MCFLSSSNLREVDRQTDRKKETETQRKREEGRDKCSETDRQTNRDAVHRTEGLDSLHFLTLNQGKFSEGSLVQFGLAW